MRINCECGLSTTVRVFPFYCKCKRHYDSNGLVVEFSDFPLDCKYRGKQFAERERFNCGCNGKEPVYECSFPSGDREGNRKCVRSKYKTGKVKEVVCLYCKDYESSSTEPIGNQST